MSVLSLRYSPNGLETVVHSSSAPFSTNALNSTQIPVTVMDLDDGGIMGYLKAVSLSPLESAGDRRLL